jgi:hypothetical protein
MNENEAIDQTKFAEEEPLFEPRSGGKELNVKMPTPAETSDLAPGNSDSSAKTPIKKSLFKKIILIAVGVIVFIVVLALIARQPQLGPSQEPTASPSPSPVAVGALNQRVNQLKLDLKSADPTKQELVFPPVNLNLRLDKKTK